MMKIQMWTIGKAHEAYIKPGVEEFTKRISHYYSVEWQFIQLPKTTGIPGESELRKKEGEAILNLLKKEDFLIALDQRGRQLTSEGVALLLETKANESFKQLVFLIGGAYGLDEPVIKRANFTWSLSMLVFPHQLVRLILAEQIYRACTITRNEKYHHS